MDVAIANIGRSAKRNQQSISLGTTPLVAANILPPAMREFRKQRPDVRIQLFDADLPMVVRAAKDDAQPRKTMTWSALDGETLISLSPGHPHQQLIDKHLVQAGVKVQIGPIVNLLDTQIALVEAEEGIAIIPSFGMPACRNRNITTSQLINPLVRFDFHMISRRGRKLPPEAVEFTSFLKSYIALWAGRAGVL